VPIQVAQPQFPPRSRHATDALALEALDDMLDRIPIDPHAGLRDRALLPVGIAAALRRSELVALDAKDIRF
jgi:site-specific recombinase XerC